MRRGLSWLLCGGALVLSGCASGGSSAQEPATSAEPGTGMESEAETESATEGQAGAERATVALQPTEGHQTSGHLQIEVDGDGVRVTGTVEGLTPGGKHGFHIHAVGDCSAPDASSAGPHYTVGEEPHGHPGHGEHHLGDMKNLEADDTGRATVDQKVAGATLGGGSPGDILGKAVVVHQAEDDYATQPAGASGARIACGVIQPAQG